MAEGLKYAQFKDEWVELYNKGYSIRQIGIQYGIDAKTVNRTITPHIEKRRRDKWFAFADEWVKLYVEHGYTRTDIANQFKTTVAQVSKVLTYKGIPKEFEREKEYDAYVDEWIALYENGASLKEISDKYNASTQTVLNYLKEKEITIRTSSEALRIYHINDDYFDELTKEKAYHLGLLYSIGSTLDSLNSYAIQIATGEVKRPIMYLLLEVLREEKKGIYVGADGVHRVRFHSEKLFKKLREYGLYNQEDIAFPVLKEEWIAAFIVGYLEGAGRVDAEKNELIIEGSHLFLQKLKGIFETKIDKTLIRIQNPVGKAHYRMVIEGYSALVVLNRWLMLDSHYYTFKHPAKNFQAL